MVLATPVKALAFVIFVAAIAGATYGVNAVLGDTLEAQALALSTPRNTLDVTEGNNATFILTVANRASATRDVSIAVTGAATSGTIHTSVRGGANASVFVTVAVPPGIPPGEHALDVQVSDAGVIRARPGLLTLNVLPAGPGYEHGDRGEAIYTARLSATGRMFGSNDRAVIGLALPRTDTYRFQQDDLVVVTSPRATVVEGIARGVVGMQVGESRTLSFPPELGYGPAADEQLFNRDDVLKRNLTLANDVHRVTRAAFDQHVRTTEQGNGSRFAEGDVFTLTQNDNKWPYRIANITNESVDYQLSAVVGDSFTIYPFWTNASVVTAINDTHVSFRTTPNTQPGEKFSAKGFWPLMSTLKEVTEEDIVIRHTPPIGFAYTTAGPLGQPREGTVRQVNETRVVVAFPSENPLAGKDLTFDITMLRITKP